MTFLDQQIKATQEWFALPRFKRITRLFSARQVAVQRGVIGTDYRVAREAAAAFYDRLRDLFDQGRSITTFGPYSPSQAVAMKRLGIEGIYLGGWATSAKGSVTEDPGPDLASYPLSQVPDEASVIVRALLSADRNQQYQRSRMSEATRKSTPTHDFRPWIIADADTGHGGDPHVRNLVRRFVEVGVPGYHIEDQRPGTKKCGHQGGKVLVASDEQIKRLNAARFQLDLMGVAGIIVARTDAEAATLLDGRGDERDQPFILGVTNVAVPTYKSCFLAMIRRFYKSGIKDLNGHLLYNLSEVEYAAADAWIDKAGIGALIKEGVATLKKDDGHLTDRVFDTVESKLVEKWEQEAGLKTYGEAVAEALAAKKKRAKMTPEAWRKFAKRASLFAARSKAADLGVDVVWDCEHSKTPEGYYQVRGGVPYAIAKSLAVAPYADLIWMETATADLDEAREFAEAIHAEFPEMMLAYNLSPSFNWDSTGMTDKEMRAFPVELGKMGFVFNFMTYGGHQIDGVAAEDFATALQQDGMLALARLQRRIRLVESPYRTPQTLIGGPRADAALSASSGRTATTKAMGKGSTQHQHLVQTEVPTKLLEEWLGIWSGHYDMPDTMRVSLRPRRAGSEQIELAVYADEDRHAVKVANIVFSPFQDRKGKNILSVQDMNTFAEELRKKRLMTLLTLWMIHRYDAVGVHYVTPTSDNKYQSERMKAQGVFARVSQEGGQVIVADVDKKRTGALLAPDRKSLGKLIRKESLKGV